MSHAVEAAFPPGIRLSHPQGGFVLWVKLPRGTDAMTLLARALAADISVAPGPMFSVRGQQFANFVRLNCGAPWSERIGWGVERPGQLV